MPKNGQGVEAPPPNVPQMSGNVKKSEVSFSWAFGMFPLWWGKEAEAMSGGKDGGGKEVGEME